MEATRTTADGSRASLLAKMEDEKIAGQDMLSSEYILAESKSDLSAQDPVKLGRKLNTMVSRYVGEWKILASEKPAVEQISTWTKLAKP